MVIEYMPSTAKLKTKKKFIRKISKLLIVIINYYSININKKIDLD